MVQEKKMSDRFVGWKKAAAVFAVTVLANLAAPAISTAAIDTPLDIVYNFLRLSIGKSPRLTVIKNEANNSVTVRAGARKGPPLKAILRTTMRQCAGEDACKAYPGTELVAINVEEADGTTPVDFVIEGDTAEKRLLFVRQEINAVFIKNPLFVRSMTLPTSPPSTNRDIGVYCLFNPRMVQVLTNDPTEWGLRSTFLAQEMFRLFLVDEVPDGANPPIPLFLSTGRN
ncbi:MAG: hypothetical protein AB9873_06545 [Syntrophobacteraceae bacterium]